MNIYDIAKLANVSIATVSRVVNNSPKVSPKTKEKVLAVMKENEYTPNAFARGLGLGSMKTVGIICPNIDDIYMAKAVSYLEQNLHAHHNTYLHVLNTYNKCNFHMFLLFYFYFCFVVLAFPKFSPFYCTKFTFMIKCK